MSVRFNIRESLIKTVAKVIVFAKATELVAMESLHFADKIAFTPLTRQLQEFSLKASTRFKQGRKAI